MKVYGITVDYDQIPADTPAHRELREQAKDVPTSWSLTGPQLQVTEAAGRFLLRRHPCYRALFADLQAIQPPAASETDTPTGPCATEINIAKPAAKGIPAS